MPDGLSRLPTTDDSLYLSNAELDALFTRVEAYYLRPYSKSLDWHRQIDAEDCYVHFASSVIINLEFKTKLVTGYELDPY